LLRVLISNVLRYCMSVCQPTDRELQLTRTTVSPTLSSR